MFGTKVSGKILCVALILTALLWALCQQAGAGDIVSEPYLLDTELLSRSISFENPTGAPGEGGKAASKLGVARGQ